MEGESALDVRGGGSAMVMKATAGRNKGLGRSWVDVG